MPLIALRSGDRVLSTQWFESLQSPTESGNRYERQGHAKNSHTGPNIVKVSTM